MVCVETPLNHKKGSVGVDSPVGVTRGGRRGALQPLKVDDGSMRRAQLRFMGHSAFVGGRGRRVRRPVWTHRLHGPSKAL